MDCLTLVLLQMLRQKAWNTFVSYIPGEVQSTADALVYLQSHFQSYPIQLSSLPQDMISFQISMDSFSIKAVLLRWRNLLIKQRQHPAPHFAIFPTKLTNAFCCKEMLQRHNASRANGIWYTVEESVMKEMLGFSLQPFYSKDWGIVPSDGSWSQFRLILLLVFCLCNDLFRVLQQYILLHIHL